MAGMRPGVRLGVDVGTVRVGVASCDPAGLIATPVETVRRGAGDLARLGALAREHRAMEVVVGLPVSLSGAHGKAAGSALVFAQRLAPAVGVPVRLVDERLSTVDATRTLRESGLAGKRHRAVIDQAAAVIILQSALDAERSTGTPPGVVLADAAQVLDPSPALDDQGEA
jgi:putative Holliday junction resolvase